MPKTKLSCRDHLDWVQYMTKTRQDNDVTVHMFGLYQKWY